MKLAQIIFGMTLAFFSGLMLGWHMLIMLILGDFRDVVVYAQGAWIQLALLCFFFLLGIGITLSRIL